MRSFILFIFANLIIFGLEAQQDSTLLLDWQLDENLHQLEISSLPKKLPKKTRTLKLSYRADHSNSKDFFTLGKDAFYIARKNAFKINKRRYTGQLWGYDKAGSVRYLLEFRKGKLDGNYVIYGTDGSKSTKVYSNGRLISDTVRIEEEN